MKYRKKPTYVDAWQFEGWRETQRPDWLIALGGKSLENGCYELRPGGYLVQPGDWVVRDEDGDIFIMMANAFEANYEAVLEHRD